MKKPLLIGLVCVLSLSGCSLFKKEQPKPLTIDLTEAAKNLPIDIKYVPPVKINIPRPDADGKFNNPEEFRIDNIFNSPLPDKLTIDVPTQIPMPSAPPIDKQAIIDTVKNIGTKK